MWRFEQSRFLNRNSQLGMTIIELVMATGIVAIIMYAAISFFISVNRSKAQESLRADVKSEVEEFLNSLRIGWNARASYSLLSQSNAPCTTNCPSLKLTVAHGMAGTLETKTYTSGCVSPGSINAMTRFNTLNFGTAMPNGCMACPQGLMPIVTVTSAGAVNRIVRFPHNGSNSASSFRINGILGFNACFTQSGTSPLMVAFTSVFLSPSQKAGALSVLERSIILPYTNFANMKMNAN
jgi:type II secretory pathway pseudopilin PulG